MRGIGELLSRVTLPSIGEARPSPLVTIGDRIGEARPTLRVSRGLLPWLPSLNPDPEDRPHHRNDGTEPEPEHQRAEVSGVRPRPSKSAMTPPSATRVADGRDNAAERRNPAPGCLAWAKGGAQLEAAAAVATGEAVAAATAEVAEAEAAAEAAAEAVAEAEAAAARCRLTGAESRLEGATPVVQIPLSATDVSTCSERAPDRLSLTESSAEPEPRLMLFMVTLEPAVVCVRPPVPGCACV